MSEYVDFKDYVEAVRRATDILSVIGADAQLTQAGRAHKCKSPLRADSDPSFYVYPDDQKWWDFGLGEGGDVFDYVKKKHNFPEFVDAVHYLADRFGVRRFGRSADEYDQELRTLLERRWLEDLMTDIADWYHTALPSRVRQKYYREKYGFTDETIDRLKLGYSSGEGLYDYLEAKGHSEKHILKTGFFIRTKEGIKEFFAGRLVIPYWKLGKCVYAIARQTEYTDDVEHEKGKYKKLLTHNDAHKYVSKFVLNTHFYNEDCARRGGPLLVISEGVTDCISAMQAGFATISPVTTRFPAHSAKRCAELASRFARTVVCNDNEENQSGEKGAIATAQMLFENGLPTVAIAQLPLPEGADKIDLNEYLKAHTSDEARVLFESARGYVASLIHDAPVEAPLSTIKDLLKLVTSIAEPIERERHLDAMADHFRLKRRVLNETIAALNKPAGSTARPVESPTIAQDAPAADPDDPFEPPGEPASAPADGRVTPPDGPMGSERILGAIVEDEQGYYYRVSKDGSPQILSSFVIEPRRIISTQEQGDMLVGDIVPQRGVRVNNFTFPRSTWKSRRDLLTVLPSADLQWTGDDNNVQGLLRFVTKADLPRCKGTTNLGYYESADGPRWVGPGIVITPDAVLDDGSLTYVSNGSSVHTRLMYRAVSREQARGLASQLFPLMLGMNEPKVMLPAIGWFIASVFKPRVMRLLHHFPILFVWGTHGSGKTSMLRDVLWRLVGMAKKSELFSITETDFATTTKLGATDSIPIGFDEYKPSDMPKGMAEKKHRLLRRAYGGETEERGRSDLSVRSYDLKAPIFVAGEQLPEEDPALRERLISVNPSKNSVSNAAYKLAFDEAVRLPIEDLAVPFLQWTLTRDVPSELDSAREITQALLAKFPELSGRLTPRPYDNLLVMVFGLMQFEAFAQHLGVEIAITPEMIEPCVKAVLTESVEGDAGAKDGFDAFLEDLSSYAHLGLLRDGVHYSKVGGLLCLHLRSCHDTYLQERKRTGREDATNGMRALRRIAEEKFQRGGYITDMERRVEMGGRQIRCVAIDMKKIPSTLDVDEFPAQERAWGGPRDRWAGWENGKGTAN